jgi:hypothetical protein
VAQEAIDFGGPHLDRVPFAVKENEAPDPMKVSLLGAEAVMIDPQRVADLFEQLWLVSRIRKQRTESHWVSGTGDRGEFGHGGWRRA